MSRRLLTLCFVFALSGLVGLLLLFLAPQLLFSLLHFLGMAVLAVAVLAMFVTLRKSREVKPAQLAIPVVMGFLVAFVVSLLTPASPGVLSGFFSFSIGLIAGAGWGTTREIFHEEGKVSSRGNAWYLLVWAALLLMNHGIALVTGRPPAVGFLLVWFGAGLLAGQSAVTYFRYRRLTGTLPAV